MMDLTIGQCCVIIVIVNMLFLFACGVIWFIIQAVAGFDENQKYEDQ